MHSLTGHNTAGGDEQEHSCFASASGVFFISASGATGDTAREFGSVVLDGNSPAEGDMVNSLDDFTANVVVPGGQVF